MAPGAISNDADIGTLVSSKTVEGTKPLKLSGVLDAHEHVDLTPAIGREFPTARLVEWLEAPNSDELLRDLAITSQYP